MLLRSSYKDFEILMGTWARGVAWGPRGVHGAALPIRISKSLWVRGPGGGLGAPGGPWRSSSYTDFEIPMGTWARGWPGRPPGGFSPNAMANKRPFFSKS